MPKQILKRQSCCCGATKKYPCACMIKGTECSNKAPKCHCYTLLHLQIKRLTK